MIGPKVKKLSISKIYTKCVNKNEPYGLKRCDTKYSITRCLSLRGGHTEALIFTTDPSLLRVSNLA
jgi:hypothetical protein